MRDEDHPGVRGRVERGEQAARLRGQDVAQSLGASGQVARGRASRSRSIARTPAARGEVAALREDHERVVVVEAGGQLADLLLQRSPVPVAAAAR